MNFNDDKIGFSFLYFDHRHILLVYVLLIYAMTVCAHSQSIFYAELSFFLSMLFAYLNECLSISLSIASECLHSRCEDGHSTLWQNISCSTCEDPLCKDYH